jgi:hypothetical protein
MQARHAHPSICLLCADGQGIVRLRWVVARLRIVFIMQLPDIPPADLGPARLGDVIHCAHKSPPPINTMQKPILQRALPSGQVHSKSAVRWPMRENLRFEHTDAPLTVPPLTASRNVA